MKLLSLVFLLLISFSSIAGQQISGSLRLKGATSGVTAIKAADVTTSGTYTLPANTGSSSQVLSTDGNGVLSWASVNTATSTWTTFTTVFEGAGSNPTKGATEADHGVWWRQGDAMCMNITYYQSSGSGAGSGLYLIKIPAGKTIDTGKISVSSSTTWGTMLGTGFIGESSTDGFGSYMFPAVVHAYDSTRLWMVYSDQSSSNLRVNRIAWASTSNGSFGGKMSVQITNTCFPISNW